MGIVFEPIDLVKGDKKAQCLHAVDLAGWVKAGWKKAPKKAAGNKGGGGGDGLEGLGLEALQKIAKSKGIDVDARWGEDRLIKEIRG